MSKYFPFRLVVVFAALAISSLTAQGQPKRIYIAVDDHTDYYWTADGDTYRQAFIDMIDYYLDLADQTDGNPSDWQSRFVCDGSFWLWEYEKNKTEQEWQRLISRLKSGHISAPMTPLVVLYGGVPAEAALRSLYYAGSLERRHGLDFQMALSMENQVMPWGLASLWAGAGAKYTWKGICGCATKIPDAADREHEAYYWQGPDGQRVLTKWNSILAATNRHMGGYAEARNPASIVDFVSSDEEFLRRYPYEVVGCFGNGWDDLETMTDEFLTVAEDKSNAQRRVIVSNELDFFEDLERTHGNELPHVAHSFGNEWDLYSASLSEVSAQVKRSLEKLRAAEAMATLASLFFPGFMDGREAAREKAFLNFGLYFEHDWTADGPVPRRVREQWQREVAAEIESYVDALHRDAAQALGELIAAQGSTARFYVFNPLGWQRTDYADLPFSAPGPVHVVDLASQETVPSQVVEQDGAPSRLRILAGELPSLGYRVYEVRSGSGQAFGPAATISGGVIENGDYRVTVAPRGAITSLLDKKRGSFQLASAADGFAINDLGSSSGTLSPENIGPVSVTLKASGPDPVRHTSRITLYRGIPRIDIRNEITENFSGLESWAFGFNLENPIVRHEEVGAIALARLQSQGGHYANRSARYDWLTLNHFADMTGDGPIGITLSNWDTYFFRLGDSTAQALDSETPRISALAGGQVDGRRLGIRDQGGDEFFRQRFALQSHGPFDPAAAMRMSLEHQNPPVAGLVTGGMPSLPAASFSALSNTNPNVLLWALKPAEEGIGQGIVLRLWNLAQSRQTATIRFLAAAIKAAQITSHIETDVAEASYLNGALEADFASQQIRTFRLIPDAGEIDLEVALQADPATVESNQQVAFSATVVNRGTKAAAEAGLEFKLPEDFQFLRSEPASAGCQHQQGIVNCLLHDLRPGGDSARQVTVVARAGLRGSHTARAEVSGGPESVLSNNVSEIPVQVVATRLLAIPAQIDLPGTFVAAALLNGSDSSIEVDLLGLDSQGRQSALIQEPIMPRGQSAFLVRERVADTETLLARSPSGLAQGFFLIGDFSADRMDGVGADLPDARTLYFQGAHRSDTVPSVLFLFNPDGAREAAAQIELFDAAGRSVHERNVSLMPWGSLQQSLGQLFESPDPIVHDGWVRVESDVSIRGFQLIAGQGHFHAGAGDPGRRAAKLWAPHIFLGSGRASTRIGLLNLDDADVGLEWEVQTDDGARHQGTRPIGARSSAWLDLQELLQVDTEQLAAPISGFLELTLDRAAHIVSQVLFDGGDLGTSSALPLLAEGRKELVFLHVAHSSSIGAFQGLAFLNPHSRTAEISLEAYDSAGNLTAGKSLELSPRTRAVGLLSDSVFFGDGFDQVGGSLRITASEPLLAQALLGNSRFLSALAGQVPIQSNLLGR